MSESISSATGVRQVRLAPTKVAHWVDGFFSNHGQGTATQSGQGIELGAPDGWRACLTTRWPDWAGGDLADFTAFVSKPRDFGIVLVRRASCAVALVKGGKIVAHRTLRNYVQGRTKAGGWSQQRFQRRRANQSSKASQKAVSAADEVIDTNKLVALVIGGDKVMVENVLADGRLKRLAKITRIWVPGHVPNPNFSIVSQVAAEIVKVDVEIHSPTVPA